MRKKYLNSHYALRITLYTFLLFAFSVKVCALDFKEDFRLRIHNDIGGSIEVSSNQGKDWRTLGFVLYPTNKTNPKGFTASKWAEAGCVAATSVNAIHIKVANPKKIFSILPKDFLSVPKGYHSYLSPDSAIYTDISAGSVIFGGEYSSFVGNRVLTEEARIAGPLKIGQNFTILVDKPKEMPKEIDFENKFGGKVTILYPGQDPKIIGEVLRPVFGVGRFAGSRFISSGRIRANHPGVIDISMSVGDKVGGFQIIPSNHAESPEMASSKILTQWMIVGSPKVQGVSLEGTAPLFKYFLKPEYNEDDLNYSDWDQRILKRFLVEVKYENDDLWEPMPIYTMNPNEELPDEAMTFLQNVAQIRILFPMETH